WRAVAPDEAAKVWGKGNPSGPANGFVSLGPRSNGPSNGPNSQPPNPRKPNGTGGPKNAPGNPRGNNCQLCMYSIMEAAASGQLSDTPVGYTPPLGPSASVTITYNQREDSQPANFAFFNLSAKWTFNWLGYVTDDPTNPGANVTRYMPEGGAYYYSGY